MPDISPPVMFFVLVVLLLAYMAVTWIFIDVLTRIRAERHKQSLEKSTFTATCEDVTTAVTAVKVENTNYRRELDAIARLTGYIGCETTEAGVRLQTEELKRVTAELAELKAAKPERGTATAGEGKVTLEVSTYDLHIFLYALARRLKEVTAELGLLKRARLRELTRAERHQLPSTISQFSRDDLRKEIDGWITYVDTYTYWIDELDRNYTLAEEKAAVARAARKAAYLAAVDTDVPDPPAAPVTPPAE